MKTALPFLVIFLVAVSVPAEAASFRAIMELLDEEDVAAARPLIQERMDDEPGEAESLFLQMRLRFLENRFTDAMELLNALRNVEDSTLLDRWQNFEALVQSTWAATQNHKRVPMLDGQVIVHVEPGVDEVLLLYIEEAIRQSREVYADLFGVAPYPDPLHIHIYGKIETLAAVSSLKVSEIQNSGTIALCKYNRLMLTSPRDLLFGYDWLNTLAHEYIHYVIHKRNGHTVPIWIHEGLAKFLENRWAEEEDGVLRPSTAADLREALEQDRLISFEAMSPSMAKLPSQEATSLAFAEVFTVMDYLKEKVGMKGIRQMLDLLNDGESDREAFEAVLGVPFKRFESNWKKWLSEQPVRQPPTPFRSRLYFKNKNQSKDEVLEIGEKQAQDFVYLGDLLRARERLLAASKEYEKAVAIVGEGSPLIQAKIATTLLKLERPKQALDAVALPLSFHPKYVLLRLYQGKAHLALGQHEKAAEALKVAVSLNPFDLEIHESLLDACIGAEDTACVERERAAINLLNRP